MATGGDKTLEENKSSRPKELPLEYFVKITDNFKRLLGTGPFGSVYKGILEDGREVAVKKLNVDGPVPPAKLFSSEVQKTMPDHKNIVKLVSFCRESAVKPVLINGEYRIGPVTETVLCYEYFPKGSLDKHIFGGSNTIGWNTRFNIIKGISKGLQCLHCLPRPLLHLGLKPQNILLDDNMVPKISDFIFSRIFDPKETRKRTMSQVGTEGYMAPEYVEDREISAQSDIYSLGIIIMEIVTREMNESQKHARQYIDKVTENWNQEKIMSEYDELDGGGVSEVEACLNIALQCVKLDQRDRPTIQQIIDDLRADAADSGGRC